MRINRKTSAGDLVSLVTGVGAGIHRGHVANSRADHADDFVIATGEANSLRDFVDQCFTYFGLDWAEHVQYDDQLIRPNEIRWSQGNSEKAHKVLGWQASKRMRDVVKILCDAQRETA